MTKRSKAGAAAPENSLRVDAKPNETDAATKARTALRPTVNAAVTLRTFLGSLHPDMDLSELVTELSNQCAKATDGDFTRAEGMLTAQAHTLDAIFGSLARRAALNMGEYVDAADRYMRLALKAQSQCRATLETLAMIKNPHPTVIARQANIAHTQQVNNESSRTREIESQQSKLLEQTNGEGLDTGATGQAIGTDSHLEAVGAVHWAKDDQR